jgi:hypothetical protein
MAQSALRALVAQLGTAQGPTPSGMASWQGAVQNAPQRKPEGQQIADVLGGVALPMSAVPFVGDVAGLAADAAMYANYPEERTPLNYGLSALGVLPFVPSAAGIRAGKDAVRVIRPGEIGFDPRFDPRVKEQERIAESQFRVEGAPPQPKEISIFDLEGQPFILGMADRTSGSGRLLGIDDVDFDIPVENFGGQDYMFRNPGLLWASDKGPVSAMMNRASAMSPASMLGGKIEDPLFLPFRMAPSGGDFATMTTDVMLTYARNNMTKKAIRSANKDIKAIFPSFRGVEDPTSMQQLAGASGNVRKAVQQILDKKYRTEGGLNLGQARLAVTDPNQYTAMDLGLGNVGRINATSSPIADSMHPTYSRAIPGEGLGVLKEKDISAFELLPELVQSRGVTIDNPAATEIYNLRMGVRSGRITESALRNIEARRASGQ